MVLQPIQVKAYARMHLRRAKKRQGSDAVLIAACAATIRSAANRAGPTHLDKLAQHLTFVEQVEEDICLLQGPARTYRRAEAAAALIMTDIVRWIEGATPGRAGASSSRYAPMIDSLHLPSRSRAQHSGLGGNAAKWPSLIIVQMCLNSRPASAAEEAAALAGPSALPDDDSGTYKGQRHIARRSRPATPVALQARSAARRPFAGIRL